MLCLSFSFSLLLRFRLCHTSICGGVYLECPFQLVLCFFPFLVFFLLVLRSYFSLCVRSSLHCCKGRVRSQAIPYKWMWRSSTGRNINDCKGGQNKQVCEACKLAMQPQRACHLLCLARLASSPLLRKEQAVMKRICQYQMSAVCGR